ncbi:MAG TPA: PspC domain-containing protein [Bryobacteraceae bacterium]|nr:PspC domain-containing protein [Bryobacteraceae bacterium]HUJ51082.1 PspC domain-containing protein [Bryobacteraceae bacterium]
MTDDAAFCSRCGKATGAPAVPQVTPPRRLSRPMYDKKIAGVCAGFARYFEVDVTLMRILWIIVALFTGVGLIAYIVAWIAMPKDETRITVAVPQQT